MYILECCDGSYYTGSTQNLELRLYQHQNGKGANHTKKRLPVKLVYFEEFERIDEAFYREKQIQGWSRKKKEALMAGKWDKLHDLAQCQNDTHSAGGSAGFDSAQPTEPMGPTESPKMASNRCLSEVEPQVGSNRCLSEVEPQVRSNRCLSEVEPQVRSNRCLSEVEGTVERKRGL